MVIVEYEPINEGAAATLVRTGGSTQFIESALRRALPGEFQGDVWGRKPLDAETLSRIERHTGPLSATTRLCLRPLPRLLLHTKDGFVRIYLPALHRKADGQRIAAKLAPALRAASMGSGAWETRVREAPPSIDLSSRDHAYRIPRIELPIPADLPDSQSAIGWVEDELGDALFAAMINQALWSSDPETELAHLPRRASITAQALEGVRRERVSITGAQGMVAGVYTWVLLHTNVTVSGPVFLGRNTHAGNGLMFTQDGW